MPHAAMSEYYSARQGPDDRASGREIDLFDLIAFVWTQKFLAIFVALVVFIPLAALVYSSIKPTYEATSRLLVILDEEDPTPGAAGSGGAFTLDQVMESEREILDSDVVRRRAGLAQMGSGGVLPLTEMREGFSVSRAPNSSILIAAFEDADPDVAANTLNAIIDAYLTYRVELLVGGPEGAFEDRLAAAENEAALAEAALREFLNEHGLSDFASERAAVLARITDLQARQLAAEADAQSAASFARSLASRLQNIPQTIELYVENSVTGQLLDLQVRREELLARYQPGAPPVQAVEREITALQAFIDAGGAEGQGQRRTGTNPVWQTLEGERLQQESYANSQSRLATALAAQLGDARELADRLRGLAPLHDRLKRAADARSEAAQRLSVQVADASARRNAPAGAADAVRVVERAAPPSEASSLMMPALVATFVFAAGLGVFAALIRGYLVSRGPGRYRRNPFARSEAQVHDPAPSEAPAPQARARPARDLPILARVQ